MAEISTKKTCFYMKTTPHA